MVTTTSRRGFALLTVLWLVALLGGVTSGLLMLVRRQQRISANRGAIMRVQWAENACLAILQARYAGHPDVRRVDSTDLGHGVWCRATVTDLAARVNLNLASGAMLRAVLGSDSLAAAVMDWRDADSMPEVLGAEWPWYAAHQRDGPRNAPFRSVNELVLVRGFETAPLKWLDSMFTVEGDGRINPNLASPATLQGLPGLDAEAIHMIAMGPSIAGLDQLVGRVSSTSRRGLESSYRELNAQLAFQPAWLEARLDAGVEESVVRTAERVLLVPLESRLAIISRQPW
jgi:type II secretory pathway component PulK